MLLQLEALGFAEAPRWLGTDDEGRDIVSFIPGVDGRHVAQSDRTLREVAALLRRYHDAARSLALDPDLDLPTAPMGLGGEPAIVCHNDVAPYNVVFEVSRPVGIIDWDLICLGPPIWDVVNALWGFVLLYTDADAARLGMTTQRRGERMALFCAAYGGLEASAVLPTLRGRPEAKTRPYATRSLGLLDRCAAAWQEALDRALIP